MAANRASIPTDGRTLSQMTLEDLKDTIEYLFEHRGEMSSVQHSTVMRPYMRAILIKTVEKELGQTFPVHTGPDAVYPMYMGDSIRAPEGKRPKVGNFFDWHFTPGYPEWPPKKLLSQWGNNDMKRCLAALANRQLVPIRKGGSPTSLIITLKLFTQKGKDLILGIEVDDIERRSKPRAVPEYKSRAWATRKSRGNGPNTRKRVDSVASDVIEVQADHLSSPLPSPEPEAEPEFQAEYQAESEPEPDSDDEDEIDFTKSINHLLTPLKEHWDSLGKKLKNQKRQIEDLQVANLALKVEVQGQTARVSELEEAAAATPQEAPMGPAFRLLATEVGKLQEQNNVLKAEASNKANEIANLKEHIRVLSMSSGPQPQPQPQAQQQYRPQNQPQNQINNIPRLLNGNIMASAQRAHMIDPPNGDQTPKSRPSIPRLPPQQVYFPGHVNQNTKPNNTPLNSNLQSSRPTPSSHINQISKPITPSTQGPQSNSNRTTSSGPSLRYPQARPSYISQQGNISSGPITVPASSKPVPSSTSTPAQTSTSSQLNKSLNNASSILSSALFPQTKNTPSSTPTSNTNTHTNTNRTPTPNPAPPTIQTKTVPATSVLPRPPLQTLTSTTPIQLTLDPIQHQKQIIAQNQARILALQQQQKTGSPISPVLQSPQILSPQMQTQQIRQGQIQSPGIGQVQMKETRVGQLQQGQNQQGQHQHQNQYQNPQKRRTEEENDEIEYIGARPVEKRVRREGGSGVSSTSVGAGGGGMRGSGLMKREDSPQVGIPRLMDD